MNQASETENVDLKLSAALIQGHLFERAIGAVARVIDEHVYPSGFLQNGLHGGCHRGVISDIQRQQTCTGKSQWLHPVHASRPSIDDVPGCQQAFHRFLPDA